VTIEKVIVFVDWDTARRIVQNSVRFRRSRPAEHIESVFVELRKLLAEFLRKKYKDQYLSVAWNVYHGWHNGKTETLDYKNFQQFSSQTTGSKIGKIAFSADYRARYTLFVASSVKVFDTFRTYPDDHQKMVDTLLVTDLLCMCRSSEGSIYVVISDDDDAYPGIATAFHWVKKVHHLHLRKDLNKHLDQSRWAAPLSPQG
jgi:hypothetical protein